MNHSKYDKYLSKISMNYFDIGFQKKPVSSRNEKPDFVKAESLVNPYLSLYDDLLIRDLYYSFLDKFYTC
jgi:hypothetical protein